MKFYRDNRIVPPIIAFFTICLLWTLIDRSASTQHAHIVNVADLVNHPEATNQDPESPRIDEQPKDGSGEGDPTLSSDDVLLIIKTGATVLWKRLPIHMTTTLAPERIRPQNTVIYSEVAAKIGNHAVIDILADMPDSVKSAPSFELYHAIRDWEATNWYVETTGLPGDDAADGGPPGGWRLDKYKFLPLVQHAGRNWPDVKWYLYTEDDTYLFLPNVLRYLAGYDHAQAHWLGGLGEKLGTTFAHGGSGFALSRGAWERSFGTAPGGEGEDLVSRYQGFVDEACCGDYALGKVLNDFGVRFGEHGGNEGWSWGFNGLPHWKIEFSQDNWCAPVLTWHHAHNRDIARYHELEMSWDFNRKSLDYGDFYRSIIAPSLSRRKPWWDNFSSRYEVHSTSVSSSPRPDGGVYDNILWTDAWKSADDCEAACLGWARCVQWYYYGDDCKMDDRVFMGHGYPEGMRYRKDKLESVSGWLTDRVNSWKCD